MAPTNDTPDRRLKQHDAAPPERQRGPSVRRPGAWTAPGANARTRRVRQFLPPRDEADALPTEQARTAAPANGTSNAPDSPDSPDSLERAAASEKILVWSSRDSGQPRADDGGDAPHTGGGRSRGRPARQEPDADTVDVPPSPSRATRGRVQLARPSGIEPIGAAMEGYLAHLATRRKQRTQVREHGDAPSELASVPRMEPCPHCGGAGYLRMDVPMGHPSFGQPVPCSCKEREFEERRQREEEIRLSELDRFFSLKPFSNKTFETFDAEGTRITASIKDARQAAWQLANGATPGWQWLVLMGSYGTGKTHLAAAIAHYRLERGSSVYFAIVPELLDHLRAAFAPNSELSYDEMFDRIREVELLVLDDLGAENNTAWATEKLFQLINYRYNYRLPTVITTNQRLHSQMDERIRSRLSDASLVRIADIKGTDYRPSNVGNARRAPRR